MEKSAQAKYPAGKQGTQQAASTPVAKSSKASLDHLLSSTNFPVYQRAAAVIKNYQQIMNTSDFNPNALGKVLYSALGEMVAEAPNKDERQDITILMDALQRNLQNNSLTKEAFEATVEHARSFMTPYAQKVKDSLEESHYKNMALGILQNKKMFGDLYSKLSMHPSAARANQFGIMLTDIEGSIKKNDLSNISSYYMKLVSPTAVADYVKTGKTKEEATKIVETGKKAYQALLSSLSDSMKAEHQAFLHKLIGQSYYQAAQKIDVGYIKNVMSSADSADILALIPQERQGMGYQSE
ncbi:MAG: hypothetical protein M1348_01240 [Candidatus Parvarchaeota archaeon]|jgi:hypothetical protein|nr:hypothetical protein [Candidatus Parvarchaeota archaeon]